MLCDSYLITHCYTLNVFNFVLYVDKIALNLFKFSLLGQWCIIKVKIKHRQHSITAPVKREYPRNVADISYIPIHILVITFISTALFLVLDVTGGFHGKNVMNTQNFVD